MERFAISPTVKPSRNAFERLQSWHAVLMRLPINTHKPKYKYIMRKVTEQIASALVEGKSKSIGNTSTDGKSVYLHGNEIASLNHYGLTVSLAGWNTRTTRERINGLLSYMGFKHRITQKDFEPYFNGKLIEDYCAWNLAPFSNNQHFPFEVPTEKLVAAIEAL